jgi:DNA replication protein DnaC
MELDENDATIAACAWVAAWHSESPPPKGLLVAGPTGTGKTSVAAAIAHDCDPAAYWPMRELARRAREDALGVGGFVPTLVTRPLLVIDDVGVERTDFQRDVVREIIEGRSDRAGRLVLTTNLTKRQLKDHLGDRCWSRLNAMCSPLTLTGRDRRLPE